MMVELPPRDAYPESWSEEEVEKINGRLTNIADGIDRMESAGKTPEEIVRGWRSYATAQGIQVVDLAYDPEASTYRITISEDHE